jgi:hypothetical protein
MKKWIQKLPVLAILLMVLFPFLPAQTASAQMPAHEMNMECMPGEDCEREMQKHCIEHCIELAQSVEQQLFWLQTQEITSPAVIVNPFTWQSANVRQLLSNHSPPVDPRLHRITVQRE